MAACGSRLRLTVILQMGVFCMAVLWASAAAAGGQSRKLAALVEEPSVVLTYHDGPLLSASGVIPLHLIWYGQFTPVQRSIVADFVQSFGAKTSEGKANQPSASTWWKTTHKYDGTHSNNKAAPSTSTSSVVMLGKQKVDQQYSLGKSLKRTDIAALVEAALKSGALPPRKSPGNANAVYLLLTSEDVTVEGFCMSSCGFHATLNLNVVSSTRSPMMQGKEAEKHNEQLPIPYAWVGNSATQCPGQCAWPFHQPMYVLEMVISPVHGMPAAMARSQQSTEIENHPAVNQNQQDHIAPPFRTKLFPCIELRCNWELTAVQALMLA